MHLKSWILAYAVCIFALNSHGIPVNSESSDDLLGDIDKKLSESVAGVFNPLNDKSARAAAQEQQDDDNDDDDDSSRKRRDDDDDDNGLDAEKERREPGEKLDKGVNLDEDDTLSKRNVEQDDEDDDDLESNFGITDDDKRRRSVLDDIEQKDDDDDDENNTEEANQLRRRRNNEDDDDDNRRKRYLFDEVEQDDDNDDDDIDLTDGYRSERDVAESNEDDDNDDDIDFIDGDRSERDVADEDEDEDDVDFEEPARIERKRRSVDVNANEIGMDTELERMKRNVASASAPKTAASSKLGRAVHGEYCLQHFIGRNCLSASFLASLIGTKTELSFRP